MYVNHNGWCVVSDNDGQGVEERFTDANAGKSGDSHNKTLVFVGKL